MTHLQRRILALISAIALPPLGICSIIFGWAETSYVLFWIMLSTAGIAAFVAAIFGGVVLIDRSVEWLEEGVAIDKCAKLSAANVKREKEYKKQLRETYQGQLSVGSGDSEGKLSITPINEGSLSITEPVAAAHYSIPFPLK